MMRNKGNTHPLLMRAKTYTTTMEIKSSLSKAGTDLSQDPAISLLAMYPKDALSYHRETCLTVFSSVLFITARNYLGFPQQMSE